MELMSRIEGEVKNRKEAIDRLEKDKLNLKEGFEKDIKVLKDNLQRREAGIIKASTEAKKGKNVTRTLKGKNAVKYLKSL